MKRILSIVLACTLLVGCLFTLSACGNTLSGAYEAKAELLGQSISTTYDFHGSKVDIIVKTTILGNVNTETVEATYKIEEVEGKLEMTITKGENDSSTVILEKGDGYIKLAGIQYNKVK